MYVSDNVGAIPAGGGVRGRAEAPAGPPLAVHRTPLVKRELAHQACDGAQPPLALHRTPLVKARRRHGA